MYVSMYLYTYAALDLSAPPDFHALLGDDGRATLRAVARESRPRCLGHVPLCRVQEAPHYVKVRNAGMHACVCVLCVSMCVCVCMYVIRIYVHTTSKPRVLVCHVRMYEFC